MTWTCNSRYTATVALPPLLTCQMTTVLFFQLSLRIPQVSTVRWVFACKTMPVCPLGLAKSLACGGHLMMSAWWMLSLLACELLRSKASTLHSTRLPADALRSLGVYPGGQACPFLVQI